MNECELCEQPVTEQDARIVYENGKTVHLCCAFEGLIMIMEKMSEASAMLARFVEAIADFGEDDEPDLSLVDDANADVEAAVREALKTMEDEPDEPDSD